MSAWASVTLVFPAGTRIAVPPTHELLSDGRLKATFTPEELRLALEAAGGCVECHGYPPCVDCEMRPIHQVNQPELFNLKRTAA